MKRLPIRQTLEDWDTARKPHQNTHTDSSSNGVDRLGVAGMGEKGPYDGQGGTTPRYRPSSFLFLFSCGALTCRAGPPRRPSTYDVRHITSYQQ
jgi:hypothetical protein